MNIYSTNWASRVAVVVKNTPTNAGDVREAGLIPGSGNPDPLEKEMATHSSLLAWKIPWTEEPGRPQSMELQRARQDKATKYAYMQLI